MGVLLQGLLSVSLLEQGYQLHRSPPQLAKPRNFCSWQSAVWGDRRTSYGHLQRSRTCQIFQVPLHSSATEPNSPVAPTGAANSHCSCLMCCRLVSDAKTGDPKGFAFCEYFDVASVQNAIRLLNNKEVMGRKIRIDYGTDQATTGMEGKPGKLELHKPLILHRLCSPSSQAATDCSNLTSCECRGDPADWQQPGVPCCPDISSYTHWAQVFGMTLQRMTRQPVPL